jgi:hypothetical protein
VSFAILETLGGMNPLTYSVISLCGQNSALSKILAGVFPTKLIFSVKNEELVGVFPLGLPANSD